MADLEASDVVAAIANGDLDDSFADLTRAMRDRVRDGAVEMRWGLKFGGHDITQDNQSIAEVMSVERQTGKTWQTIQPAGSAAEAGAIMIAALVERDGMKPPEAVKALKIYSAQDVASGIYEYVVEPPLGGGDPPT